MKIRTGFVSNSSSSSFVVAFPHKPKSVEDLKKMMFGKQDWHYTGLDPDPDTPVQPIVETVFFGIKKKATKKEIYESIRNGWFDAFYGDTYPGHYDDKETAHLNWSDDQKEIERSWKKAEKINNKRAKNIADAFTRFRHREFIVVLGYGDNNGSFEAILEHTDIFNRIDHIRTSYH